MKVWMIYGILGLLGIPVMFFNLAVGLGWVLGHAVMILLVISRERFYSLLLDTSKFSMFKFGSYIIYTVGLIALPLAVSFYFQHIINPFAIFAAYFVDRAVHFIFNLFMKEETHAS